MKRTNQYPIAACSVLLHLHVLLMVGCGGNDQPETKPSTGATAPRNTSREPDVDDFDEPITVVKDQHGADLNVTKLTHKVWALYEQDEFEKLDELFAVYREKRLVLQDGTVVLSHIYSLITPPPSDRDKDWGEHFQRLDRWIKQQPQSVTPLVLKAGALIRFAWRARGTGSANTVTEEGWRLYRQRTAAAQRPLESAAAKSQDDPEVFATMVLLGKAVSWPRARVDAAVAESMKIDPRYFPTYSAMTEYLLPRWHGQPGDIESFAAEVQRQVEGDDGLDIYGRIGFLANRFDGESNWFGDFSKQLLGKAAKVLLARYPASKRYVNYAGMLSYISGDVELAREIQPMIGDQYDREIWGERGRRYHFYRAWMQPELKRGQEKATLRIARTDARDAAYSPDGSLVVTARGLQPTIQVWSVSDLSVVGELQHPLPETVRFDHTGQRLFTLVLEDRQARVVVHELSESGRAIGYPEPTSMGIYAFATKCGRYAVYHNTSRSPDADESSEKKLMVMIRDFASPGVIQLIEPKATLRELVISPDGKLVAGREENTRISVWDSESGELKHSIQPEAGKEFLELVDVTDDGNVLCCVKDRAQGKAAQLVSQDLSSNQQTTLLDSYEGRAAVLSADRRLLASLRDQSITVGKTRGTLPAIDVWDLESAKRLASFEGHWGAVGSHSFSPDSRTLVSCSDDGTVKFWDVGKLQPK